MKKQNDILIIAGVILLPFNVRSETSEYERYSYDSVGNLLSKDINGAKVSYFYNQGLLERTGEEKTFKYDQAGRMAEETGSGDHLIKLSYQYEGKVVTTKTSATDARYQYNAEGHLVAQTIDGSSEVLAWDGLGLMLKGEQLFGIEEHATGGLPVESNGEVVVCDHLANTISVGDRVFHSTAFGEGLEDGLFAGKPHVKGINGYIHKYRTYQPEEARWSTIDPVGFPDGINNQSYSRDPLRVVDPDGTTQLYISGIPKKHHVNSNSGSGIVGKAIRWSYLYSKSYYASNFVEATNNSVRFQINAYGINHSGPVSGHINLSASIYHDGFGNVYMDPGVGVDKMITPPISTGVHVQKIGEGTKVLVARCDAEVGHNGRAVTGFGINKSGIAVKIEAAAPKRVHFRLGEFMWQER